MPRGVKKVEPVVEQLEETQEVVETPKEVKTSITLQSTGNVNGCCNVVRTFTKESHGEDFMKLANDWKKVYNAIEIK